MRITICGSIAFYDEMLNLQSELEKLAHEVKLPPSHVRDESGKEIPVKEYYALRKDNSNESVDWIWMKKRDAMKRHFEKVEWSDAVVVANYDKNGIKGYIGANTLMEMGLALHLNKGIYLLNPIPEVSYKEEILGMQSIILNGNLRLIE